jgi:dienelactone hydrolase
MTAESASRSVKTRASIAATALWLAAAVSVTPNFLSPAIADQTPFRVMSSTGSDPQPAVLLPGCSGFVANNGINVYDERAAELRAAGFLVVYVDYVGKRMQSNCAHVGQAEVSADILDAVKRVAGQNGVDPSRIFVIGWSYGAGGVLAALNAASPTDPPIAKAVLYYPVCRGAGPWSSMTSSLMLLGAADDIASPALCNAVAKGAPAEKLKVITYPNARHGFDMRGLPETQVTGAPAYNQEAAIASWAAALEFLK